MNVSLILKFRITIDIFYAGLVLFLFVFKYNDVNDPLYPNKKKI